MKWSVDEMADIKKNKSTTALISVQINILVKKKSSFHVWEFFVSPSYLKVLHKTNLRIVNNKKVDFQSV